VKKYWTFAGDHYYPGGGVNDFQICTDDLRLALSACESDDWGHVATFTEGDFKIIASWWAGGKRTKQAWSIPSGDYDSQYFATVEELVAVLRADE